MTLMYVVLASVTWNEIWVRNVCWWMILNSNSPQHRRTLSATPMSWYHHRLDNMSLQIPTGPFCTISQFWLFTGQCKSIADQWKLLYIFWKQSGDLHGWRVWLVRIKLHTNVMVRVRVRFRVCCPAYSPSGYVQDRPSYNISLTNILDIQMLLSNFM